ncbi:hypothetical protein LWI29_028775 [Acer saccharum]|uniref:Uncharacterized protein n=1 Tax=Acer saccharum TaxID=4024 RepID=A0AA39SXZ6_ACESA|nr:hypothetical protein LWI29_028775 [Acer saccharum]
MQFSDDAEETFENALGLLQKQGMLKEGEEVALVQSGDSPSGDSNQLIIFRSESVNKRIGACVAQLVTAEEFPHQLLGGWPCGSGV